ncbi:NAD(P)H-dependent oxidoreductase [Winogradskyella sp. SYSU M77433]|uniref:NAD(P)H-dependent oxidoreductase n=1 Tax=Winogradskyella sp. SYSU M77433 TaxID=3042722 RepID=UPI002480722F|nr:NAD(P)H-dependent oxidoreductase [Winogradskyella sp. SYSU M77433]MDH7913228.1 NAD(P)H-dependent oxidoreductase [Winogradskyella sp. SYSU M77433]
MNMIIENLKWRYATKKFDSSKTISTEDFETLKKAMQLTASSYGLQPYKILNIVDKETRTKLRAASWNQSQIEDASHMIVLANMTDFGDELVDNYFENVIDTRNLNKEDVADYANTIKSTIGQLSQEQKALWTAKQAYIVVGNLLSAAAQLRIDACPMEGFQSEEYNKILDLNSKNLNAAVVVTLGYRSEEDGTQHYKKVRKSENQLFTNI